MVTYDTDQYIVTQPTIIKALIDKFIIQVINPYTYLIYHDQGCLWI